MAPSMRTPWLWQRRRQWAARGRAEGELLYVAIGDSAAQGIGVRDLDSSYVGLLRNRLQRLSGRTVRVVNLSRYGARIGDALDRQLPLLRAIIDETGREPDLVTVAIGANDMRDVDHDGFVAGVERLIDSVPRHAVIADLPCFHFGPRELNAADASRAIETRVRASGRPFAPLHRVTELRRGPQSWAEFTWDQFHPNRLGYRVWESAFASAVNRRARQLRLGD
ncbi:SGNH/GDSL hydrolase family protein [Yonghaparkia sp. Soil809]|uniref:SGNH/GDSL hydrolase family protein n=1 Tax=Yonghaparkia sp. Soil809 TaxID=1736417 RepID=UPI0009E93077|nr:SGNH/GDSL hydrolase family protein [Yonghaparkia sp. Soil809]